MEDQLHAARQGEENTYLLDPESPVELARLINLDRLATRAAGGPLAGLTEEEIAGLHNVVDLGAGYSRSPLPFQMPRWPAWTSAGP
jgi:hypothetical protein